MFRDRHPFVGIDATPLATGHAVRGIGRYLRGLLEAVWTDDSTWAESELGLLLIAGQDAGAAARVWRTFRSPVRPQDLDIVAAGLLDRWAIRGRRPTLWHHTDPTNPWSPMRRDRTIATAYDLIPMREPAVMSRMRAHRRLAYRGYLRLIRGVRGVIAISRTTADDLGAILDVTDDRIRIVPPFVKQWVPPAVPDSSCQSGRPSFLFVGVPDPHKRPELAVDALSELVRRGMDATLDFAGVQPSRDRFRLRARAEANGLAKRIRFLDRIPDAELHARFAGSVLLALSTIEGFGLPPVEAVLAGGRVVATPTPAYVESLAGVATFSTGDSAEEVADAMEVALERKVPDDAREALARAHSAPTVAAALRRAYRQFGDF